MIPMHPTIRKIEQLRDTYKKETEWSSLQAEESPERASALSRETASRSNLKQEALNDVLEAILAPITPPPKKPLHISDFCLIKYSDDRKTIATISENLLVSQSMHLGFLTHHTPYGGVFYLSRDSAWTPMMTLYGFLCHADFRNWAYISDRTVEELYNDLLPAITQHPFTSPALILSRPKRLHTIAFDLIARCIESDDLQKVKSD